MGKFHLLLSYAIFFRMFIYFIIVFQFGGLNTKKTLTCATSSVPVNYNYNPILFL